MSQKQITLKRLPKTYKYGPYTLNAPIELIGLEALQSPFVQFCTAQRITMFSSHCWQALNVKGCEYPRISSTFENQFMKYSFDETRREHDAIVVANIPRFVSVEHGVGSNPRYTIIFTAKGEADYIELSEYTALANGFGYMNTLTPSALCMNLSEGSYLDKDLVLSHPPSHKNGVYCQGINANVLLTTMPHATEDAVLISESLHKKCDHTAIEKYKIILGEDDVPLNLFGTPDDPKVFPDVGTTIGDNGGILMAIRKKTAANFANLMDESFQTVLRADDQIIRVNDNTSVIDVQMYYSPRSYWNTKHSPGIMAQLIRYQDMHYAYYEKVIKAYEKLRAEGFTISANFNDLVTECMSLRKQKKNKIINLVDKRMPIDNCVIEITCAYTRSIGVGAKFAGRAGDKGIKSIVWKDENMPVDEQGIRADIVMSPESVSNRVNTAQLYEQFINRLSALQHQRLLNGELGKGHEAYRNVMQFIEDVHSEYAGELKKKILTPSDELDFLDDVIEEGFFYCIPPFSSLITVEHIDGLRYKYNYVKSPVTYSYMVDGEMKKFKTLAPMSIGSKYIYLLGKIPEMQMSAHEMTHTNQMGIPVKSQRADIRMQHLTKPTPIQLGEDETGLISMIQTPDDTARFIMMRAGSRKATELMSEQLLTAKSPTAIDYMPISTAEVIDQCETVKFLYHVFGIVGFDLSKDSMGREE